MTAGGQIILKGSQLYVGTVLRQQPVGLRQTDQDEWEIFYGPLLLGYVLHRKGVGRLEPLR